jgi:hypothetical protein
LSFGVRETETDGILGPAARAHKLLTAIITLEKSFAWKIHNTNYVSLSASKMPFSKENFGLHSASPKRGGGKIDVDRIYLIDRIIYLRIPHSDALETLREPERGEAFRMQKEWRESLAKADGELFPSKQSILINWTPRLTRINHFELIARIEDLPSPASLSLSMWNAFQGNSLSLSLGWLGLGWMSAVEALLKGDEGWGWGGKPFTEWLNSLDKPTNVPTMKTPYHCARVYRFLSPNHVALFPFRALPATLIAREFFVVFGFLSSVLWMKMWKILSHWKLE